MQASQASLSFVVTGFEIFVVMMHMMILEMMGQ
jgi:hypothetical protein